jgi:hypothetical protein
MSALSGRSPFYIKTRSCEAFARPEAVELDFAGAVEVSQ